MLLCCVEMTPHFKYKTQIHSLYFGLNVWYTCLRHVCVCDSRIRARTKGCCIEKTPQHVGKRLREIIFE